MAGSGSRQRTPCASQSRYPLRRDPVIVRAVAEVDAFDAADAELGSDVRGHHVVRRGDERPHRPRLSRIETNPPQRPNVSHEQESRFCALRARCQTTGWTANCVWIMGGGAVGCGRRHRIGYAGRRHWG